MNLKMMLMLGVVVFIILSVLLVTLKKVREEKRRQYIQSRKEQYEKNLQKSNQQIAVSQSEETRYPHIRVVSSRKE